MTKRIDPMKSVITTVSPVRLPQFLRQNLHEQPAQPCCSALSLTKIDARQTEIR